MDLSKYFSKRDLVSILELIEDSRSCSTGEEARSLILNAREMLSADFSVCATADLSKLGGADAAVVVNGGYPGKWLEIYLRERMYRFDPVIRYHQKFSPSMTWSEINRHFDDREAAIVVKSARDFGLNYGISSSIYSPGSGKMSIFCFAAEKDNFKLHHKRVLDTITLHLNIALNSTVHGTSPLAWTQEEGEATLV
ncbi:MAG: autoinducer binding domain-containing protein [Thermodesulfobacteriota bacterium]